MGRLGAELPKRLLPQLKNWHERNTMLLDASFKSDSVWSGSPAVDYRQYMTLPLIKPVDMIEVEEATAEILRDTLETLISRLETISEIADTFPASGPATAPAAPGRDGANPLENRDECIFVIHGRNEIVRLNVQQLLSRAMGSEPVVLLDQANSGNTLVEKLERDLGNRGTYAVILMTADDFGGLVGEPQQPRSRQNVIFEAGYAMA